MSIVIDGLVTEFVAVMKRVGELEEGKEEEFLATMEEAVGVYDDPSFISGMNTIAPLFEEDEA